MEAGEHIRLAREFIADSERLEAGGNHRLAAEAIWGATIYGVEACRHRRGLRHGNNYEKALFVAELTGAGILSPETGWQTAKDKLHNHFYTNRLSDEEIVHWLAMGRDFVAGLLRIAERNETMPATLPAR